MDTRPQTYERTIDDTMAVSRSRTIDVGVVKGTTDMAVLLSEAM